jgi:hypothetical protein
LTLWGLAFGGLVVGVTSVAFPFALPLALPFPLAFPLPFPFAAPFPFPFAAPFPFPFAAPLAFPFAFPLPGFVLPVVVVEPGSEVVVASGDDVSVDDGSVPSVGVLAGDDDPVRQAVAGRTLAVLGIDVVVPSPHDAPGLLGARPLPGAPPPATSGSEPLAGAPEFGVPAPGVDVPVSGS